MPSHYSLDDFAFDLRRTVAPANTWVGSGWSTVAIDPTSVCGVDGFFAPPYAAPDSRLRVEFSVDGDRITDGASLGVSGRGLLYSGGSWRPDQITRQGTFHQYDPAPVSLAVRSTITPLYGHGGFVLEISVRNRTEDAASVSVYPDLIPGGPRHVALAEWGWSPPESGKPAVPSGLRRWRSDDVTMELVHDSLTELVPAGGEVNFRIAVLIGHGAAPPSGTLSDWAHDSTARWESRLDTALAQVPRLETDITGLDAYWRRCLASGLICLWDNPDFVTQPFVATSGIDGGALCGYAWDTGGYAPHLLALMLGDTTTDVLNALIRADLTDNYAIAPDGTGLGVTYAYSGWSLVALAAAAAGHRRLDTDLISRLFDTVSAIDTHFAAQGELCDYGTQHNLLEMRTAGWEHVVASPNAERAWSLETLATLAETSGAALPVSAMRDQAKRIRQAVAEELWDPMEQWFRCRYPDGHIEVVYSVQAFDALRHGACTPEMASAMIKRIRDGEFLGDYGVSSVSAADEIHYELRDVDWSGGGAYTGEAPQLAMTLWEHGESDLAWSVFRRILWMGQHFPYFPQEHYCDRPGTPPVGRRANIVAGLTGAEAILTGLVGVRPQPDGSLVISPRSTSEGTVTLTGLQFRGHVIDVSVGPDGTLVTVDGRRLSADVGSDVTVVPPHEP